MDVDFGGAFCSDGGVEEVDNLGREGHAGNGADRGRGVPCKVIFVGVGEGAQLSEDGGRDQVGGLDRGIMDLSDVNEVKDCTACSYYTVLKLGN